MFKRIYLVVASIFVIVLSPAAHTGIQGSQSLQRFFKEVSTYSANFQQVILDENFNPIEESSGKMTIKRPGKFRWDYDEPNPQQVVSDGDKVWFYDIELEQITVKPLKKTLGKTPASLLAGGANVNDSYDVTDINNTGEIAWVRLTPKAKDSDYKDMRLGFAEQRLQILELLDSLGQTTRITLSNTQENVALQDERFVFKPPKGIDIIDESKN